MGNTSCWTWVRRRRRRSSGCRYCATWWGHDWWVVRGARQLELTDPDCPLRVGDKVWVIPSHCCTTINLHDEYFCVRGGRLEGIWPIDARGKIR